MTVTTERPSRDAFPAKTIQTLRYNDMDTAGHVNNAVYATLFEAGRVPLLYNPEQEMPPAGCHFSIVRLTINFLAETTWPGEVTIGTAVTRIGNSSADLFQAIFDGDRCCATAENVIVLTDSTTRKSTKLPDHARAWLQTLMLQEQG
ncbi:acyl-CoA thioesterase [Oricola thermophila]|uniref:Acyl-CoA thioesterase n=1 Tax=Oricola thermophila TaxID=2742145 RepID=A0A6N1VBM5_9HYPH|nr:thioesterase family protein [Oricola thermophila]QKV18411.1 acyl-CoA thioesterase [Oricola thermophila]